MSVGLNRFVEAQDAEYGGYDSALSEIRQGRKRSHWIWYVFPQLAGMGHSSFSQAYAIADRAEAVAYLQQPMLRARLLEITQAVADQLRSGTPLVTLIGSEIDALKLVSSMTLFHAVARGDEDIAAASADVLEHARSAGYPPCAFTLTELDRSR